MKIGFIGAGNMGSALARAAALSDGAEIYLYDRDEEKAKESARKIGGEFHSAEEIARLSDYIFLGVKPGVIASVIYGIAPEIKERENPPTLVSMAAGISVEKIEKSLSDYGITLPVIRIMPNTPAAIGKGVILYCGNSEADKRITDGFIAIMEKAGSLHEINEEKIDAASAVSGCGPAFVYTFIEALSEGGALCGLSREEARRFAIETVIGAAELLLESGEEPSILRDAVCSPGGSTIEGVRTLNDGDFDATVKSAVIASYKKTLILGK